MCSCFFRFSSPFFRSLYIRLNIQRDFCLDYAVIKGRVMVTPLIVLFFCDLSCPELLSFFRPGHQPRIQFRCFKSASSEEREKIRFRDRLRKRIASRMTNILRAGLGKALPNKYLTEGTKNAEADFCDTGRYLLSLLSRASFVFIQTPFFINVHEHLRLLQFSAQK